MLSLSSSSDDTKIEGLPRTSPLDIQSELASASSSSEMAKWMLNYSMPKPINGDFQNGYVRTITPYRSRSIEYFATFTLSTFAAKYPNEIMIIDEAGANFSSFAVKALLAKKELNPKVFFKTEFKLSQWNAWKLNGQITDGIIE